MFSITVLQGNNAFSWNTKAISCGSGPRTQLAADLDLTGARLQQSAHDVEERALAAAARADQAQTARRARYRATFRAAPAHGGWRPARQNGGRLPRIRTATSSVTFAAILPVESAWSGIRSCRDFCPRDPRLAPCPVSTCFWAGMPRCKSVLASGSAGKHAELDIRLRQRGQRLRVEFTVIGEHRHQLVVGCGC